MCGIWQCYSAAVRFCEETSESPSPFLTSCTERESMRVPTVHWTLDIGHSLGHWSLVIGHSFPPPNLMKRLILPFAFLVAVTVNAADDFVGAVQKGLFEEEANHNLEAAIQ